MLEMGFRLFCKIRFYIYKDFSFPFHQLIFIVIIIVSIINHFSTLSSPVNHLKCLELNNIPIWFDQFLIRFYFFFIRRVFVPARFQLMLERSGHYFILHAILARTSCFPDPELCILVASEVRNPSHSYYIFWEGQDTLVQKNLSLHL